MNATQIENMKLLAEYISRYRVEDGVLDIEFKNGIVMHIKGVYVHDYGADLDIEVVDSGSWHTLGGD